MSFVEFEQHALEVEHHYPDFVLVREDGRSFLRGRLAVVDSNGKLWHYYDLEIHPSRGYPKMFPIVFETGGAIRRIADWHINTDGSCCLDNEFGQQIKCFDDITLIDFLEKELIPWLANQSHRRVEGHYVNGEQEHGDIGRIVFFMKELRAPDLWTCISWMLKLAENNDPPRQSQCFCESGQKWRHCHKPIFQKLRRVSPQALWWAINRFYEYAKGGPPVIAELQRHTDVRLF